MADSSIKTFVCQECGKAYNSRKKPSAWLYFLKEATEILDLITAAGGLSRYQEPRLFHQLGIIRSVVVSLVPTMRDARTINLVCATQDTRVQHAMMILTSVKLATPVCTEVIVTTRCDCLEGWIGFQHCEDRDNTTDIRLCMPGWMGDWCADLCLNDTMCGQNQVCKMRGRGLKCACDVGWTGRNCTLDVDECTKNPCKHSGSCVNTVGSYTCTCPVEWQGNDCEDDVNECQSDPCQNFGTCVNTIGSYNCSCAPSWRGKNCTETDWCANTPCKNSATCTNARDTYQCTCASGWKGFNCTDDIDECVSNPCVNAVFCNNTAGSYTCTCTQGWEGKNCDKDIDECASTPCANSGVCANAQGSYKCACAPGWQGDNCENDINECNVNPCQHASTCSNIAGSYTCACALGWQGENCIYKDSCLYSPCENNATCTSIRDRYQCACASGWKGINCSDDVDECTSASPCKNQGTCNNTLGSYMCNCSAGWQGDVCDVDVNECLATPCNKSYTCKNTQGSFSCEPFKKGSSASSKAGVIAGAVIGPMVVLGGVATGLLVFKHKFWNKGSVSSGNDQLSREENKTHAENADALEGETDKPEVQTDKPRGRVRDFIARTRFSIGNFFTKK